MNPSIDIIKASDGSGNANVATVQSIRSALATTIDVNTVSGIPTNFCGSMGTPHTFTDPVTSETITVISEATAVDFRGHVDGSNLEIDEIAPGYTDAGSAVGDIVIIRPTTQWSDNVAEVLEVAHNDDGTIKNDAISTETMFTDNVDPVKRDLETMFNHVASGGVWTGDSYGSTRAASMTALVAYINGQRGTISAVTARSFTASKDTYVDILNTAGVFSLVYTEVANNAASPALAANSIRLAIIVTDGTDIQDAGSINQGQESKVLPIASSVPYQVTDSLGNLICPRDPNRRVLGYRQRTSAAFTTTSNTAVQITELSCPVIVPTGRKVKITVWTRGVSNTLANDYGVVSIWDGTVGSGTKIHESASIIPQNNASVAGTSQGITTPSTASKTYNAGFNRLASGTSSFDSSSTYPGYILVELI